MLHAIIPAGGVGSRLWPLSRRSWPKFLLDLEGHGRTMLQETIARIAPRAESVTIVTGVAHEAEVREQMSAVAADLPKRVIVEPEPRGTFPAIALATLDIARRFGEDAVVGSFAADHAIGKPEAFRRAVDAAEDAARSGRLATIGISPDRPATGFGYIHVLGRVPGTGAWAAASSFVEKPDLETARGYLETGEYLWNAGMFVFRVGLLSEGHGKSEPVVRALEPIAESWDGAAEPVWSAGTRKAWAGVPEGVIDKVLAEPMAAEGLVAVVPADMDWSDVGDFAAVRDLAGEADLVAAASPRGHEEPVVNIGSKGSLVYPSDRPVVLVDVPEAVVVDAGEVLLVPRRDAAQHVKAAVDALGPIGRDDLR